MANPEHLAILEQGVEAWNEWRIANLEVLADFVGADLAGASLARVDLGEADFTGADICGAYLTGANLRGAFLKEANLSAADLIGADLSRAYLRGANLSGADLREASLSGADLSAASLAGCDLGFARLDWAHLEGADFSDSFVERTTFLDVDLSAVSGLETVMCGGPSSIDIDTIYRSKGIIPEAFLRAAGVPNDFILRMRALKADLKANPIQYHSCFISHSSVDKQFAERLYADLWNEGVSCYYAREDRRIGDRFRARIHEKIRSSDKYVVVLSQGSVESPWVEQEVKAAFERERPEGKTVLFPIRLDDAVMQAQHAGRQASDAHATLPILLDGRIVIRIKRHSIDCSAI
jgi:hypothetical protein